MLVKLKCKKHPSYKGKRAPLKCPGCWFLYVSYNLEKVRENVLFAS